jgi:hypothetical protein
MDNTNEFNEPIDDRGPTEPRELNDTREPTDPRGSTQPRELRVPTDSRQFTQPRELNVPNEFDHPIDPNDLKDPDTPKEGLRASYVYVLVVSVTFSGEYTISRIEGVYMDFRDAVGNLKYQRQGAEKNSWIAPMDRKDRENYPYRNRIGEIRSDSGFLGWGYAWSDPEDGGHVNRIWIEKNLIWRREDGDHLSGDHDEQLRIWEATSDIEFNALGQELPANSRFDEYTQDLRFSSEDGDRGEDGLAGNVPEEMVIWDDELEGNKLGRPELGESELGENEPGENELGKYDPEVSYDDENDLYGRYRENDQEVTFIRGDGERNDCEHNDHEGRDGEENVQAEEDLDDEFGLRALQRRGFA